MSNNISHNLINETHQNLNIESLRKEQMKDSEKQYDEPGIYFAFGNICFVTATFLLGLPNFYKYNPIMLTIFGFFSWSGSSYNRNNGI